jgi:undecaprenyl-diphosphatase
MRLRRTIPARLLPVYRRLGLAVSAGLVVGLSLSALVLWSLAELSDEVVEGESRAFDETVLLGINDISPEWLDAPMRAITALGYYYVVVPLMIVAIAVFLNLGRKLSALLLAISTCGGLLLTFLLKDVFERARPELFESGYTASFYSFPSGHATVAVGFYGTLAVLVAYRLGGLWRWGVALAGLFLILSIGYSRLYLGVHYPTDILAGYLSAAIWVCSVGTVLFVLRHLRARRDEL